LGSERYRLVTRSDFDGLVCAVLMRAVDQADSADYALHDILDPQGWTLLNFLMDSRTGLGRFRDFRISNYRLMMQLIEACQHHGIDEILSCRTCGNGWISTTSRRRRSSLDRSSSADIGALMLSHGGGGHANAGTCQVPHDDADRVVDELVGQLNAATRTPV
jgi:hypothetical protein